MNLTKEEVLKCLECCGINQSCNGCPLEGETLREPCGKLIMKKAHEYLSPSTDIDIPRIIDEAMEKKDRSVTVFVGPQGTTVNVYPYQETKPHWIRLPAHGTYECSECGINERYESPYCPGCGEKLAISDTFYECNKCRNFDKGLCDECTRCKGNSNFKPIDNSEVTEDEPETPVE